MSKWEQPLDRANEEIEMWKARAEAAEKARDEAQMAWIRTGELRDQAEARAEAAEKQIAEFKLERDYVWGFNAGFDEAKEQFTARVEELEARIRVMEHDHGIDLSLAASRAEAAEEELAAMEYEYRNTEPI